ncbi:Legumainlike [Aplysia californica] [Trichostrongylus colubriformis]|uniref:Legumainlike [Aplysia californica] n=1 Tax=Trichostrongylus colubriformis TaxID=6319 RepID=A0AAN8GAE6_TRICO
MMLLRIALLVPLVSLAVSSYAFDSSNGELYAVLVAGSNGWFNYRHQADIAHAYHTLLNHRVKAANIIVMMYDDIANHTSNPYKGKLFNRPGGPDVYAGLQIDYKGDSVNPHNFMAVLKGDKNAVWGGNGRVLESTSSDRVFVYFADHGAEGLIAFPDDEVSV